MLRLAIIGGGIHCSENHLPALSLVAQENPGLFEYTAFCDSDPQVCQKISARWPFKRLYQDTGDMLRAEKLDACIAVTPIGQTAEVAIRVLEAGVPLLMEKPPGRNLVEATLICNAIEKTGTDAMVSMNRRFDPVFKRTEDWVKDRGISSITASMLRIDRREHSFFRDTAIHLVDTLRFLAGEVLGFTAVVESCEQVCNYRVEFCHASGARGLLRVLPDCGREEEVFLVTGPGYNLVARSGSCDEGSLLIRDNGVLHSFRTPANNPEFIKNGTFDETKTFLDALSRQKPMQPSPKDVLDSVRICEEIQSLSEHALPANDKTALSACWSV